MKSLLNSIMLAALFASAQLFAADALVGEYMGKVKASEGNFKNNAELCFRVYREGDTYKVGIYQDLWKRATPYDLFNAKAENGVIKFDKIGGFEWTGVITPEKITGTLVHKEKDKRVEIPFEIAKLERKSPTLGEKAPKSAVVLFDGKNFNEWRANNGKPITWKINKEDASMEVAKIDRKGSDISTDKKFRNFKLHIEFMIPDEMRMTLGQHRSNSGVFCGRFEVQVLDSFGADGLWNECGSLYKFMPPQINASLPPCVWQTYDIEYRAPICKGGKKVANPRITVLHNGMKIHNDVEITEGTEHTSNNRDISRLTDAPVAIKLQDHNNPIRFRNIWIEEIKD